MRQWMQPTNQQTSDHANNEASEQATKKPGYLPQFVQTHRVFFQHVAGCQTFHNSFCFCCLYRASPCPFSWQLEELLASLQTCPSRASRSAKSWPSKKKKLKMSCGQERLDIFRCTSLLPNSFGKSIWLAVLWRLQKSASSNHKKRFNVKSAKLVSQEFLLIFQFLMFDYLAFDEYSIF